MIYLYSGTPGAGKSYHAVKQIKTWLKKGNVLANFGLNVNSEKFLFWDNEDFTVDNLIRYARENHVERKEGQTLIVLDEAQLLFNSRNWNSQAGNRMDWIKFFSQHRKLGYTIILIAQFDRMIDRQIRCLIEYEVAHMKINNYWRIIPVTCFIVVHRWYGQKMKVGHEIIIYSKRVAKLYDTFSMFDSSLVAESGVGGSPTTH